MKLGREILTAPILATLCGVAVSYGRYGAAVWLAWLCLMETIQLWIHAIADCLLDTEGK